MLPHNAQRGEVPLQVAGVDLVIAAEMGRLAAVSSRLGCQSFPDLYSRLANVELNAVFAGVELLAVSFLTQNIQSAVASYVHTSLLVHDSNLLIEQGAQRGIAFLALENCFMIELHVTFPHGDMPIAGKRGDIGPPVVTVHDPRLGGVGQFPRRRWNASERV